MEKKVIKQLKELFEFAEPASLRSSLNWYMNPSLKGSSELVDVLNDLCPQLKINEVSVESFKNLTRRLFYCKTSTPKEIETMGRFNQLFALGLREITHFLKQLSK